MKSVKVITLLFLCLWSVTTAFPQDTVVRVKPLDVSNRKTLLFDLWVTGSGGSMGSGYSYSNFNDLYNMYASLGLRGELYFFSRLKKFFPTTVKSKASEKYLKNIFALRSCLGLEYKFDRMAYRGDHDRNSGVYGQWLVLDADLRFLDVLAGVSVDFLVKNQIRTNAIRYTDFSTPCFNPVAVRFYMGIYASLSFVELEMRIGTYLLPMINPDLYAYYNLNKLKVDGQYFQLKLSFRLFTNSIKI